MKQRDFLVVEVLAEQDPVSLSIGYAKITVKEDRSLEINQIGSLDEVTTESVTELIKGQDIITKSAGVFYSTMESLIEGFSPTTKPCGKIIGIINAYATTTRAGKKDGTPIQSDGADHSKRRYFSDLRQEHGITYDAADTYRKTLDNPPPPTVVLDGVIFTILFLKNDLIERYKLWQRVEERGKYPR